jgi:hypothetical protein
MSTPAKIELTASERVAITIALTARLEFLDAVFVDTNGVELLHYQAARNEAESALQKVGAA